MSSMKLTSIPHRNIYQEVALGKAKWNRRGWGLGLSMVCLWKTTKNSTLSEQNFSLCVGSKSFPDEGIFLGLLAPVCKRRPTEIGENELISILACTSSEFWTVFQQQSAFVGAWGRQWAGWFVFRPHFEFAGLVVMIMCMCYEQHPGRTHQTQSLCVTCSFCRMAWCPPGAPSLCWCSSCSPPRALLATGLNPFPMSSHNVWTAI